MKKSASRGNKVGLKEIAAEAKVSIATVSRVLNGNNRVDPAIQMAVLEAAAKFDLDLLQRNKAKALAFLLSNRIMLHPFHSRILSGAEGYCAAQGWDIVFLSFNYPLNARWDQLHLPKILERRDVIRAVMLPAQTRGASSSCSNTRLCPTSHSVITSSTSRLYPRGTWFSPMRRGGKRYDPLSHRPRPS